MIKRYVVERTNKAEIRPEKRSEKAKSCRVSNLLCSWCFKPIQPQRIISGLKETLTKKYVVERSNKAETRPEEQSEKAESCQEYLWNGIQLNTPYRQKQTQEQNKKSGQARLVYV